jgi:hypothetical protein
LALILPVVAVGVGLALLTGATFMDLPFVAFVWVCVIRAAIWVYDRRPVTGGTATITTYRAASLEYLDGLSDEDIADIVAKHRDSAALAHQVKVDAAWAAYHRHAASPIAQLDPESWQARHREIIKTLTDLGEKVPTDG